MGGIVGSAVTEVLGGRLWCSRNGRSAAMQPSGSSEGFCAECGFAFKDAEKFVPQCGKKRA